MHTCTCSYIVCRISDIYRPAFYMHLSKYMYYDQSVFIRLSENPRLVDTCISLQQISAINLSTYLDCLLQRLGVEWQWSLLSLSRIHLDLHKYMYHYTALYLSQQYYTICMSTTVGRLKRVTGNLGLWLG